MSKKRVTGKQVRKWIVADDKARLERERSRFIEWWTSVKHRNEMSLLNAAWEAWKWRANNKE